MVIFVTSNLAKTCASKPIVAEHFPAILSGQLGERYFDSVMFILCSVAKEKVM